MNENNLLTLIHSVAWPLLLLMLFYFRTHRAKSNTLAYHIWWFNNQPSWILYRYEHKTTTVSK